jgi:hypothetical protein
MSDVTVVAKVWALTRKRTAHRLLIITTLLDTVWVHVIKH